MVGTGAVYRRPRAGHQAARLVHQPRAQPQRPHLARPGFSAAGKIDLQNSRREILKKASLNEKEQAKKEVDRVKDKYLLEIQKLQTKKEKELGA